jgi:hypothetical protein
MQTIEIRKGFKVGFEELVQGLTQLNSTELNSFLTRVNQIATKQDKLPISKQEEELIKQIKSIIPPSILKHFKHLQSKMHDDTITEKERSEMILLTDFMEQKSAERVLLLTKLSQLKGVSVLELVDMLKIKKSYD